MILLIFKKFRFCSCEKAVRCRRILTRVEEEACVLKNPMMLCVLLELTCTLHVDLVLHGNSAIFVPPIYHFNVPKLHSCILDRTLEL